MRIFNRTSKIFVTSLVTLSVLLGGCGKDDPQPGPGAATPIPMDFIGVFPINLDTTQTPALSLMISGNAGVSGTIDIPGLSYSATFTTDASGEAVLLLPAGALLNLLDTVQNLGVLIHAEDTVSVLAVNDVYSSTSVYSIPPETALDTTYYLLGYGAGPIQGSFLAVAGVVDATTLTITPAMASGTHAAGTAYTVNLNRGETYQIQADTTTGDLTGTLVQATNPVSVFTGHSAGNVPAGSSYAGQMITPQPPTSATGTDFYLAPFSTRSGYWVRIVATQPNTTLSYDGFGGVYGATSLANAGQFTFFRETLPGRITSDKPIVLAQYAESGMVDIVTTADPCMTVVPPTSQFANAYSFATPASTSFANGYANLIVPNSATGTLTYNGTPLSAGIFSVIGTSGYSQATLNLQAGSNRLSSSGANFGVIVYGWGAATVYNGVCFAPGIGY